MSKKVFLENLLLFLIVVVLIYSSIQDFTSNENVITGNQVRVLGDVDSSLVYGKESGVAIIKEEGWSTPVELQVDDDGAEDGTYITRDGRYLLYYYVPSYGGGPGIDPTIFISKRPFVSREVHPITSDDFNGETGPYISEAGDIYWTQTFIRAGPPPAEIIPIKTVKNFRDNIIDVGTG